MTALHDLIAPSLEGGSRFGVHMLADMLCPQEWALKYLARHPDGIGLTTRKGRALNVGSGWHQVLEAWYRTRVTDSSGAWCPDHGVPDLDATVSHLTKWMNDHQSDWEDPDEWLKDYRTLTDGITKYHNFYGPGGPAAEYPETQVYVDGTGPWIEREITVALDHEFQFTSRIDLIVTYRGRLAVMEHKSTSASFYHSLIDSLEIDAQPTAELFTLMGATGLPYVPSTFFGNIWNKNPKRDGTGTPPFGRPIISRTEEHVAHFTEMALDSLIEMNHRCERYLTLLKGGMDQFSAINACFPRRGLIFKHCVRFNRKCPFWALCQSGIGLNERNVMAFQPRIPREGTDATATL